MIAKALNDLQVYQKARSGSRAVFALLKRRELSKDFDLSRQLADAANSVCANISEGFGQQSDRKFAQYLFIARGSANEVRSHLAAAFDRNYITETELADASNSYDELGKMLTRFIQYLRRCDRRQRG